jgi:hypothetical protein
MSSPLPNATLIREKISQITDYNIRQCLNACDLWAARISEAVGIPRPGETAYGPTAKEVEVVEYDGYELAIWDVHTAKREGLIRKIAVPLKLQSEAKDLLNHFQKYSSDELVFPFTRAKPLDYVSRVQPVFKGLTYPIETYVVGPKGDLKKVPSHKRDFKLHALRHLRASELVEKYGFDGFNLAAYGGWTIRTASSFFGQSIPSVISRYLYLNWQGYIQKLLRKTG